MAMLTVDNIDVYYGAIHAIKGISLSVNQGDITTLIGSNGAGKSTTLHTISGLLKPKNGKIIFEDRDITGLAAHKIVGMGLVQVPEGRHVFANMTVAENLEMGAYLRKDKEGVNKDRAAVFTRFPRLLERKDQVAGTLSGGEQQMLAMGRALMSRPRLLLLDEPSMGLAPLLVQEIFNIIKEINASGTTVLLVEQNAKMALSIADKAYVLETGRISWKARARSCSTARPCRKPTWAADRTCVLPADAVSGYSVPPMPMKAKEERRKMSILVKDIMTPNVVTVNQNSSLLELKNLMDDHNLRRIPVVNDAGQVVGIVTNSDVSMASPTDASTLSRYEASYLLSRIKVKDVMTHSVKTVYDTAGLEDVADIMYHDRINSVPVMDSGNNLAGIVTDTDVFRALAEIFGVAQNTTRITLDVEDKPGILADVGKVFFEHNLNIISLITSASREQGRKEVTITVDLTHVGMDIVEDLRKEGYDVVNISTSKVRA